MRAVGYQDSLPIDNEAALLVCVGRGVVYSQEGNVGG